MKGEGRGKGKEAGRGTLIRDWEGSAAAHGQGAKSVLTRSNNCNF